MQGVSLPGSRIAGLFVGFAFLVFGLLIFSFGVSNLDEAYGLLLLFGGAVMAAAGVWLFVWGRRPWAEYRAAALKDLPTGLSRKERREAVSARQLDLPGGLTAKERRAAIRLRRTDREVGVEYLRSVHAELITQLEAMGHRPDFRSTADQGGEYGGDGWDHVLYCTNCRRTYQRPIFRRSRWLSPDKPCGAT